MALRTEYDKRTIDDLVRMYQHRQINLAPGFQRMSVWTGLDRRRLIQSIMSEYPLPNIFLFCRSSWGGRPVYDVIDGKQRLETILMFMGIGAFRRDRFDVKLALDGGQERPWDWPAIKAHARDVGHRFQRYAFQTVEVSGEFPQIVDLFVKINSTGKRLTSGEKRHANFYDNRFLKEADRLVQHYERFLLEQRVLSRGQLDRMKGTELFSELLMSIQQGSPINKKKALDKAIGNCSVNGNTLAALVREFKQTMNRLKRMFPDLRSTRFHNTAEFFSLLMLVWEMQRDKLILDDRKRNRQAYELLVRLSTGVDGLRDQYRQAKATAPRPPYSEYLLTVQGDTDSAATRQRRARILRGLLTPLFERKDDKRIFSPEQRRILWNIDGQGRCKKCRRRLDWTNFTVDHVVPHKKGGRTLLENADMLCRSCNSRKGGR